MYSGTPQQPTTLVNGVSYTGAGRMLGMTLAGGYTQGNRLVKNG